jgi:hypothetical protein
MDWMPAFGAHDGLGALQFLAQSIKPLLAQALTRLLDFIAMHHVIA